MDLSLGGLTKSKEEKEHEEQQRYVAILSEQIIQFLLGKGEQVGNSVSALAHAAQRIQNVASMELQVKYLNHLFKQE